LQTILSKPDLERTFWSPPGLPVGPRRPKITGKKTPVQSIGSVRDLSPSIRDEEFWKFRTKGIDFSTDFGILSSVG